MNRFCALTITMAASVMVVVGCKSTDTGSKPAKTAAYDPYQQGWPLTISSIEALVHANVSDDVIIGQIQKTRSMYHLGPQQIIYLHNTGVSDKVVNYMISTASLPVPPPAPAPAPTSGVNADAPPTDPIEPAGVAPNAGYVWVGGEWQWNGLAWVWFGGRWAYPPWPGAVWVHGSWWRGPFGGWRHSAGYWR
jgi:hypothetical protein